MDSSPSHYPWQKPRTLFVLGRAATNGTGSLKSFEKKVWATILKKEGKKENPSCGVITDTHRVDTSTLFSLTVARSGPLTTSG